MALTSVRFRSGMAEFPIDGAAKTIAGRSKAALEFARRTDINVATRVPLPEQSTLGHYYQLNCRSTVAGLAFS